MLFSVVIPVYNAECYLSDCLDSLDRQSFQDFEVVLVDDGSTDRSRSICEDYGRMRDMVKVISKENEGPFVARREGVAAACGEYIVPLDADDGLRPDALEILGALAERFEPDILAFGFSRTADFSTNESRVQLTPGLYTGETFHMVECAACSGNFNTLWAKAFRKEKIVSRQSSDEMRGMMYGEDWLEVLGIVSRSHSLYFLNESLYFYRPNPSSSVNTYRGEYVSQLFTVLSVLKEQSQQWGSECCVTARSATSAQIFSLLLMIRRSRALSGRMRRSEYRRVKAYMDKCGVQPHFSLGVSGYRYLVLRMISLGFFVVADFLLLIFVAVLHKLRGE
ncbi:MAG: glycosyltransferase family 2 protein [Ancrocorticia sp.]